jgi:uncharacterized membrane protein YcaP (DUF421 family)
MHVSLFELSVYAAKTSIILLSLVILYRLLGKRELAQMNAYDLATLVAVSNAVQNGMTGGRGELLIGIACSATLILFAWLIMRLLVRLPIGERLLLGQPVILLSDGRPIVDRMRRERVTNEDLHVALRQHGLADASEAALAVLEIDGSISVVPKVDAPKAGAEEL